MQQQAKLVAVSEERAQLLEMVGSSTAALASTAGRCDELMRQQSALSEQLNASEKQRQVLLLQNREGLVSAAAAVAAMKRALADLQDAVPAVVDGVRRRSEADIYAIVAVVTQSMSSRDKLQNTELFNRVMQVLRLPLCINSSDALSCSARRRSRWLAASGTKHCRGVPPATTRWPTPFACELLL